MTVASPRAITGTMLRDLVVCERRVHHDLNSPPAMRDPVGEFVRMLWAGGCDYEATVLAALDGDVVDLRDVPLGERLAASVDALRGSADVVLGAMLADGDLLGMPDIVRREDGRWMAGDVKTGRPTEADGRRPRREYAVQVALYARLLAATGLGDGNRAFVIGREGEVARYDLHAPWTRDGGSIAKVAEDLVVRARAIRNGAVDSRGAAAAICKMCHWHSLCGRELEMADDTTLVAGIGRSVRDALMSVAPTIADLADLRIDVTARQGGTSGIKGVGTERLLRFRDRARLLRTPGAAPYAIRPLGLTTGHTEIHFDIEADPVRDGLVYLHGFLIRVPTPDGFRTDYRHFFAETAAEEGDAFARTMDFLSSDPAAMIYYYSKYERSSFRALADRHPSVCSRDEVDRLFDPARAVDLLFDVIMPHTEWPTSSLSIKTLARRLGFEWRDVDASGANSIAWFDEYARSGDPAVKHRILSYNEDDVRASAVVLDGLRALRVAGPPPWPPAAA